MKTRTTIALVFKYLMTLVFAVIAFNYTVSNPLGWIALAALVAAAVNYLIGDLAVLPSMGNIAASLGDGVMGALTAYLFALLTVFEASLTSLIVFAVLVAIGEYFFHIYLEKSEKVQP